MSSVVAHKKCGGRKSHSELRPDVVALAKQLDRKRRKRPLSLREISAELAARGHLNEIGQPFSAISVSNMLGNRAKPKRAAVNNILKAP
jgi:hypothetical protein